jgi:type IV secretion system protein TrbL
VVFDSFTGELVLFSTMLLMSVLAGLLMAQVPGIAAGLLAGSAGGAGFSSLKGVTQTAGFRAGKAVAGAAAGAAGSAAGAVGRLAYDKAIGERRARNQGAAHAREGFSNGGKEFGSQRAQNAYLRSNAQTREVQNALRNMERRDQK